MFLLYFLWWSWHVSIFKYGIGETQHILLECVCVLLLLCKSRYTFFMSFWTKISLYMCWIILVFVKQLAVEYESNAMIVKVDTDDEYEFARDMQVNSYSLTFYFFFHESPLSVSMWKQIFNMQVRGLPTLLFISPDPSKDAIRTEGLIPIQMMRDIIDNDMWSLVLKKHFLALGLK